MRPKILGYLLMVGLILLGHPLLAEMAQEPKAPPAPAAKASPTPPAEKPGAPSPTLMGETTTSLAIRGPT